MSFGAVHQHQTQTGIKPHNKTTNTLKAQRTFLQLMLTLSAAMKKCKAYVFNTDLFYHYRTTRYFTQVRLLWKT